MNLPNWLIEKQEAVKKELSLNNDLNIIVFDIGFRAAAEILLVENRRISKVNSDLAVEIQNIYELVKEARK